MQAYPRRLRIAILAARDAGQPAAEVAKKYGCSESWVRRVVQQRRELGKYGPYRFRRRDRHGFSIYRRARYMILEDQQITINELQRVLGGEATGEFLVQIKDHLHIHHGIVWHGGTETDLELSPTGNYLVRPRGPDLPWDLEREIEYLKKGEPAAEETVFGLRRNQDVIDATEFPMI